jgi:glutamine amidotransferase
MCVIIHQPEGTHLEKERAERLWKKNPDGGGFAFVGDDGKISGFKSMDFDPFWKAFETSRSQFPNRDYILHMRIATHGTVDISNVHPFLVDEHTIMAHNGIIHGVGDDPLLSDTRVFVRDVLPELPETWLDSLYLTDMVEEWIGWSKLAFLTTNPNLKQQVYLLNEKSGTYADGMWFSNSSGVHKYEVVKSKTGGTVYRGAWDRPNHAKTGSRDFHSDWEWDDTESYLLPSELAALATPQANSVIRGPRSANPVRREDWNLGLLGMR